MSFSVILPTLNEKGHILKLIEDIVSRNLHLDKIKLNLEKYKNKNDREKKYESFNEIFSKHILK